MRSIEDTISESPHKYNHVYHVLDAADFPLSLIPDLHRRLSLTPQRSQNRRSKGGKFYGDRKAEMSFIITRSDLLAPRKEQVDGLMPYMLQVLRDALGPGGEDVRLGNVSCVSAKRGWWTKEVKEQIWSRGGGGWMVGKVNVGKSNLFEGVFPKGRNEKISFARLRHEAGRDDAEMGEYARESLGQMGRTTPADGGPLDETSLLPPAQPEIPFPVMPVISSLPGTTASPIRLSYGNGRGELVDLPGLPRGDLDAYVRPEQRLDLVMRDRPKPEQHVLKPGRSLLLGGGLVRITPTTPDTVVLAYPFVPLAAHVTSTEKAEAMQRQERPTGIDTITSEAAGAAMQSAGVYALRWDVTRQRSGPLTSASGAALRAEGLPYRVLSTDVVLEGVGWIELVAQVRRRLDADPAGEVGVEVFTPHGKHVAARRPMGAWLLAGQDGREGKGNGKGKGRPRRSMKGAKKSVKVAGRTGAGT
ncbi:MAG: hypothetical protein M1832_006343 [Thelocarpon impressellum]|nr:MAG: hypothetical protein M1832_006343 [Thelocarpon impressellum]